MKQPRIVCLSPSYQPYRVPVWDVMHKQLGANFTLMALSNQPSTNDRIALEMGEFNRKIVWGGYISLSRKQVQGMETPAHLIWSPGFPYHLWRERPDVVITNNFSTWTMTTIAMGYRTVLFWEGTKHTERTVGRRRQATREWVVRNTHAFVTCGPSAREYLVDCLRVPEDRVFIGGTAPLPAPAQYRNSGPRKVSEDEKLKFLFSGQLIGRKGPEHLLRAVAAIKHDRRPSKPFEVLIAGDGPQREMLEAMAESLEIPDVVTFLGFVPIDQIWSLYAQCHVFVLPTLQDNWPLVVPEAMQIGMPILLSRFAGSVPEFIREGRNGFSFDPLDKDDLANRMLTYLDEPGLVEMHGIESLQIVSSYTPEWAASAFLEAAQFVYEQQSR